MLDNKFRGTNDQWKCRYEEPATRDENITKDHTLVKSLGALGIAGMPGATIWTEDSGNVRMDTAGWNWLRPLLEELKEFRDLLKKSEEVTACNCVQCTAARTASREAVRAQVAADKETTKDTFVVLS